MVELAVQRLVGRRVGPVGRVLEQEDDAVNRLQRRQRLGLHRQELLELDILDAEVVEQVGEDALFGSGVSVSVVFFCLIPFLFIFNFPALIFPWPCTNNLEWISYIDLRHPTQLYSTA